MLAFLVNTSSQPYWKELLIPCKNDMETDQASNQMIPRGHVIPCGAVVHAMVIECPEIRRRSRLERTPH